MYVDVAVVVVAGARVDQVVEVLGYAGEAEAESLVVRLDADVEDRIDDPVEAGAKFSARNAAIVLADAGAYFAFECFEGQELVANARYALRREQVGAVD